MSVCCQEPIKKQIVIKPKHLERYRFNNIDMIFNITKAKMEDILRDIFTEFCRVSMIGYESSTGKYWCKIFDKHEHQCQLHFEVEMIEKIDGRTVVRLCPITGTKKLIENFASDFKETVELYISSPFMRACLAKNMFL